MTGRNEKFYSPSTPLTDPHGSQLWSDWLKFSGAWMKPFRRLLFRIFIIACGLLNQRGIRKDPKLSVHQRSITFARSRIWSTNRSIYRNLGSLKQFFSTRYHNAFLMIGLYFCAPTSGNIGDRSGSACLLPPKCSTPHCKLWIFIFPLKVHWFCSNYNELKSWLFDFQFMNFHDQRWKRFRACNWPQGTRKDWRTAPEI